MQNILILSNTLPNEGWGGGVIIRSLTKNYPSGVTLFWTTFRTNPGKKKETCNTIEILDFQTKLFRGRGVSHFILLLETTLFVRDFNAFLKQNNINLLWVVLGTSSVDLHRIYSLSKQLAIPFHISVHDDPILEIKGSIKQKAREWFKGILINARTIDVISSRMQAYYKKEFGVNSIVITRCIPDDFPENYRISSQKMNILMGGYGNASAPWPNPLLDSIALLNQTISCQLHLFDSKLKPYESDTVKVYDLIDELSFNSILETINIGYACDDLKPGAEKFAQLSLPTKIITYIGAGIPFLYHGPKDSTVDDLLQQYQVGIIVETNTPHDLCQAFLKIISNYSFYQSNCKLVKQKLFSSKVVQDYFFHNLLDGPNER